MFDAGTGIRYLGRSLLKDGPLDTDLYLTHTHFDHVCGLPFFIPFFLKQNTIRIWAGHLRPKGLTVKYVIAEMMFSPLFPVPPEIFAADVAYNDFDQGTTLEPQPGVRVRTAALNHPDHATGCRVEYNGKSICYLIDTQHMIGNPDQNVLSLIQGADIVIYDSTYTDAEFPKACRLGALNLGRGRTLVRRCRRQAVRRLPPRSGSRRRFHGWRCRCGREEASRFDRRPGGHGPPAMIAPPGPMACLP